LMLIERTPTPVPPNERPVENLSREELMELVQKQREAARVKQEQEQPLERKRERSATAANPRPLKTSKGGGGETVYHLDSDEESVKVEDAVDKEVEVVEV